MALPVLPQPTMMGPRTTLSSSLNEKGPPTINHRGGTFVSGGVKWKVPVVDLVEVIILSLPER